MLHLGNALPSLDLSTILDSEPPSASSRPPPRRTSSNQLVHIRPLTPSRLSFGDLATAPPEIWKPDNRMNVLTAEPHGLTIGTSFWKQLKHIGPSIRDDLRITVDVEPSPTLRFRSPVTRLPPETLAYVFELCLDDGHRQAIPVFVPGQGPFDLAQVCKFWRAIAESDARLWTAIHLYFPDGCQNREKDVARVKPMLDLHLKRSGALPISLTFADHRFYHAHTDALISLLVDRLRIHSHRWRNISLHLSCGYFPLLFTFLPCDLSSLERLHISGDVFGRRIATPLRLNLKSAKNLKSFAYNGPGHPLEDKLDLHWERLSEVSFEFAPHIGMSSTLSRQFKRLAQCQSITTCSLGIDGPFWLDLDGDQTITLPCLRTLHIRRLRGRSHARSVIDPLILPQLQTLEIDGAVLVGFDGWNTSWHDRNFSNLLTRSGCSLLRLSIQDVNFPNDEILQCLASSPALTSLQFMPCPRSQDIVDVIRKLAVSELTVPVSGQTLGQSQRQDVNEQEMPLVPVLREIMLASSVERYLDLMMAMFRSRIGAHARVAGAVALRHVEVVFYDMSHGIDAGSAAPTGDRSRKVASLRRQLALLVSESESESEKERLEASVIENSPYLVEYIDVNV